jgi:hypothetical protein
MSPANYGRVFMRSPLAINGPINVGDGTAFERRHVYQFQMDGF